jgi:hypothetical protein
MDDMPLAGDSFYRASASTLNLQVPPDLTDTNYFWDYSWLTDNGGDTLIFYSSSSTGYPFVNTYSNLATTNIRPGVLNILQLLGGLLGGGISISVEYAFYNKVASKFEQSGIGLRFGGIRFPVKYSSNDIIYRFPLSYGNVDSSKSGYTLNVPNTFYLKNTQNRVNYADGWGTLVTPYGTFNAVRVKSEVKEQDSIFVDTLGFGLNLDIPLRIEYKWMVRNIRTPILQIETSVVSPGNEIVTSIMYLDSFPPPPPPPPPVPDTVYFSLNVFPTPFKDEFRINYFMPKDAPVRAEIWNTLGQRTAILFEGNSSYGNHEFIVDPKAYSMPAGAYFLKFTYDGVPIHFRLLRVD